MIIAALTSDNPMRMVNISVGFSSSYARRTSMPVMATRPIQIAILVPVLAPWTCSVCACVFIVFFSPANGLVFYGHQINQRKHKHPDQVDKVPVQSVDFHVLGGIFPAAISDGHDRQIDHTDEHVGHMQ